MADDRVLIKCEYCGRWKMLLKHYTGAGPKTWDNDILQWLDHHANCREDQFDFHLVSPGFTLHLENEIGYTLDLRKSEDHD